MVNGIKANVEVVTSRKGNRYLLVKTLRNTEDGNIFYIKVTGTGMPKELLEDEEDRRKAILAKKQAELELAEKEKEVLKAVRLEQEKLNREKNEKIETLRSKMRKKVGL